MCSTRGSRPPTLSHTYLRKQRVGTGDSSRAAGNKHPFPGQTMQRKINETRVQIQTRLDSLRASSLLPLSLREMSDARKSERSYTDEQL